MSINTGFRDLLRLALILFGFVFISSCDDSDTVYIWTATSQRIVISVTEGYTGDETIYDYEKDHLTPESINSLSRVSVTNEMFLCHADCTCATVTVIDKSGLSSEYAAGNDLCGSPDKLGYISFVDIGNVINTLPPPAFIWTTTSQRIQITKFPPPCPPGMLCSDGFQSFDYSRDTLNPFALGFLGKITVPTRRPLCKADSFGYVINITDESGLITQYVAGNALCNSSFDDHSAVDDQDISTFIDLAGCLVCT